MRGNHNLHFMLWGTYSLDSKKSENGRLKLNRVKCARVTRTVNIDRRARAEAEGAVVWRWAAASKERAVNLPDPLGKSSYHQ